MFVILVSAALYALAVMLPTASEASALSMNSPPGSMRKKTKAIMGPKMRDSPANLFTDKVPMFEPPPYNMMGRMDYMGEFDKLCPVYCNKRTQKVLTKGAFL